MSRFRRFDIVERSLNGVSIFTPPRSLLLRRPFPSFPVVEEEDELVDLLDFCHPSPVLFDEFDAIADVLQIQETPVKITTLRVNDGVGIGELWLEKLSDRVSDLELGLENLLREEKARKKKIVQRKYSWLAEVETPDADRKLKWTAEIKDDGKGGETGSRLKKSYKWTAEVKGKKSRGYSPIDRSYTVTVSNGDSSSDSEEETEKTKKKKNKDEKVKEKEKCKLKRSAPRVVEIDEHIDHGAIVLKQVFAKRMEKRRGKRKDLSAEDAAMAIQLGFRAYMIRRSQALRALRELAIAKSKLKKIRASFSNFSYRRRLSHNAEERQRFSEKIIVLLLTVDAIEGADLMVRAAKKLMVDELEAMLDVVDPHPPGKSWSVKRRRTFDMPDRVVEEELLAASVAEVVRMLDDEPTSAGDETFEACL
ncbi:BAG family molecular chaperone regulator 7-like [Andrographis paniculata]|uniref:BAG family molecular chaperone regulator 7-like n=1 Tax=Andrographis paniculata TaxID=175694 RepID=UPI0021E98E84|nr:BAG family molecular chaperone regulator 7-like [Andrographis paniculata]